MSLRRKFRLRDARLLEFAGVIKGHLQKHEARFQAFDRSISLEWYAPILQAALDATDDSCERGNVGFATDHLQAQKLICHDLYKRVRYFVRIAFDAAPGRLQPFDLKSYALVYSSHHKLLHFFKSFVEHMRKEADTLIATGAVPALLDQMEAAVRSFDEALRVSTNTKHRRRANTSDRVEALNALYAALQRLSQLSAFVFEPEEIQPRFFKIPSARPRRKPNAQQVEEEVEEAPAAQGEGLSPKAAPVKQEAPAASAADSGTAPPSRIWEPGTFVVIRAGNHQQGEKGEHPPAGEGGT